ncbi:hypothetical protein UlMin_025944 [Ulmus minor]
MSRQNFCNFHDVREGYVEPSNLENDKVIAHAYQEELSRLASIEASGRHDLDVENLQASILAQDWLGPSNRHGRRLNEMVPVPHVPRTIEKIPSADEEISDHERLLERLQLYDLVERKVPGDGNCQFRSLSDQLYRSADHHGFVREQIVQQLRSNPEMYELYVPMAYADYLKKMSENGEWGDHVTLQAAADKYGVKIFVITSFKDTCSIEILPHIQKPNRVIFLSFWAEVHYNSIYPGDLPTPSAM